jgi:YD repeat-containing protein
MEICVLEFPGLDAAGRITSETDQAGKTSTYEYTVDGLVAQVRDERTGVTTRNTYDPTTRTMTLTETVAPDGTVTATGFEYNPVTGETVAVFDPANRTGTEIGYEYDVFGNVTQISYPDGKTLHHTFDEHGRETTSTDIAGNVTVYAYDRLPIGCGCSSSPPRSKAPKFRCSASVELR